jgi:hypothetical protein
MAAECEQVKAWQRASKGMAVKSEQVKAWQQKVSK